MTSSITVFSLPHCVLRKVVTVMENVVLGRICVPIRLWLSLDVRVDDAAWAVIVLHCVSRKSYSGDWSAVAVCLTPSPLLGWALLICLISVLAPSNGAC